MFGLITGRYLFKGADKLELLQNNKACNLTRIDRFLESVSQVCKDILIKMLDADQKKRPTASQALCHAWFQQDEIVIKDLLNFHQQLIHSKKSITGASGINVINADVSPNNGARNSVQRWGAGGGEIESPGSFTSFKMVTNYFCKGSDNL